MRDFRDPELNKTDPQVTEPIKMPKSVLNLMKKVGWLRQRSRAFVIREIIVREAEKLEKELAKELLTVPASVTKGITKGYTSKPVAAETPAKRAKKLVN